MAFPYSSKSKEDVSTTGSTGANSAVLFFSAATKTGAVWVAGASVKSSGFLIEMGVIGVTS